MVYVESDVIVIATSQLAIPLKVVDEDGEPIDFTGAITAQLRLQNVTTSELITFKTNDSPALLSFPDDLTTGILELIPAVDSFVEEGLYRYQIWVFWESAQYCFPDNENQTHAKWVVDADIKAEGSES